MRSDTPKVSLTVGPSAFGVFATGHRGRSGYARARRLAAAEEARTTDRRLVRERCAKPAAPLGWRRPDRVNNRAAVLPPAHLRPPPGATTTARTSPPRRRRSGFTTPIQAIPTTSTGIRRTEWPARACPSKTKAEGWNPGGSDIIRRIRQVRCVFIRPPLLPSASHLRRASGRSGKVVVSEKDLTRTPRLLPWSFGKGHNPEHRG
jgi:hypothetical protein